MRSGEEQQNLESPQRWSYNSSNPPDDEEVLRLVDSIDASIEDYIIPETDTSEEEEESDEPPAYEEPPTYQDAMFIRRRCGDSSSKRSSCSCHTVNGCYGNNTDDRGPMMKRQRTDDDPPMMTPPRRLLPPPPSYDRDYGAWMKPVDLFVQLDDANRKLIKRIGCAIQLMDNNELGFANKCLDFIFEKKIMDYLDIILLNCGFGEPWFDDMVEAIDFIVYGLAVAIHVYFPRLQAFTSSHDETCLNWILKYWHSCDNATEVNIRINCIMRKLFHVFWCFVLPIFHHEYANYQELLRTVTKLMCDDLMNSLISCVTELLRPVYPRYIDMKLRYRYLILLVEVRTFRNIWLMQIDRYTLHDYAVIDDVIERIIRRNRGTIGPVLGEGA